MKLRIFTGSLVLVAAALILSAPDVQAAAAGNGNAQGSHIGLTESVVSNCSAIPASINMDFGTYDVFSTEWAFAQASDWTMNCTKGALPHVSFDTGGGFSGNMRSMKGPGSSQLAYTPVICFQPYVLRQSTTKPVIDETACAFMTPGDYSYFDKIIAPGANGSAGTEAIHFNMFSFMQPGQDVAVGGYSDNFTMSINY